MAKRQVSGKLKTREERLGQLGFVKRARERARLEASAKEKAFKDQEEWTSSVQVSGCTVIVEGGSGTIVPTGRMSFLNFNPATERIQRDLESQGNTLQQIRERGAEFRRENGSGAEISDLEMARRLEGIDIVQASVSKEHIKEEEGLGDCGREDGSGGAPSSKRTKLECGSSAREIGGGSLINVKFSGKSAFARFEPPDKANKNQHHGQNRQGNQRRNKKKQPRGQEWLRMHRGY